MPRGDDPELLQFFAMNLHDHAAAPTQNLLTLEKAGLERAVFFNCLTPASVQTLEAESGGQARVLLQSINASALSLQRDDAQVPEATMRFRFGVFFHAERDAPEDGEPEPTKGEDQR